MLVLRVAVPRHLPASALHGEGESPERRRRHLCAQPLQRPDGRPGRAVHRRRTQGLRRTRRHLQEAPAQESPHQVQDNAHPPRPRRLPQRAEHGTGHRKFDRGTQQWGAFLHLTRGKAPSDAQPAAVGQGNLPHRPRGRAGNGRVQPPVHCAGGMRVRRLFPLPLHPAGEHRQAGGHHGLRGGARGQVRSGAAGGHPRPDRRRHPPADRLDSGRRGV